MKLKWNFIYKDLLILYCVVLLIVEWSNGGLWRHLWIVLLGIYLLLEQLYNHYTYYKTTKKFY